VARPFRVAFRSRSSGRRFERGAGLFVCRLSTIDSRLSTSRALFLLIYAASGAAALVYEVAWTRLLTLQMGHTVAAASTVLAAFMGGLAAGAAAIASVPIRRQAARLRVYAALEVVVAVTALALPLALAVSVPALRWAYADGGAPATFGLVRLLISLTLLGIPAAAMGATFPLAAAWFARTAVDAGAPYAANTAGAALGAIAAGFFLIPAVGLRGATLMAAALNVTAAVGALWLATTINAERAEIAEPGTLEHKKNSLRSPRAPRSPSSGAQQPVLASVAAAISGFAALVYEVAWTRLLALVIGPTTYAFATMVASFIVGLAIGSAAGTRIARRTVRPAAWLGAMLVASAALASVGAWYAAMRLPLVVAAEVAGPAASFGRVVLFQGVAVGLLLLPGTFAIGAAFPLALALGASGEDAVGRDAARVYTSNTVGAIAGALTAGFVLLPAVGLQTTFRITALVGVLAGVLLWVAAGGNSRDRAANATRVALQAAVAIALGVVVIALPSWDHELLASGAYKYAPYLRGEDVETALTAGQLEYYKEGAAATVSVRRLAGVTSLSIDGKVDASNGGDMLTQRLLGLLPVLMHDRATDVCVVGLGSGVTLESVLASGTVARADVVEISPEVVEASAFFAHENANALGAGNVRLVLGDGRSHLLLTRRRYDVIVSEPSNPWMAGVAALFTQEFFEAARDRLKPDGLLCQWAHAYDISDTDLRSVVRTFASVFPEGTIWLVGAADVLLIGTNGPSVERHLNGIGANLRRGSVSALLADVSDARAMAPGFQLLSLYAGGPRELQRFGDDAPLQRDDRLALEFSAPRGIYGRSALDNTAAIRALADRSALPAVVRTVVDTATGVSWTARGLMELKAEAYAFAYEDLRRAVEMNDGNAAAVEAALRGSSEAAAGAGKQDQHRAWLESIAARQPRNAMVRVELSRVRAASGDFDGAAAVATEAMRLAPDDALPAEQLASILADAGDADRLMSLADAILARFPRRSEARYYRATALFLKERTAEAIDEARRFLAERPDHARAQALLGAACAAVGQRDCAADAFNAALRANPRDPSTYVNLGVFRLQSADPAAAASYFAEALAIDPTSAAARNGLAQSRAALGKP
jgi:spermidine synthase